MYGLNLENLLVMQRQLLSELEQQLCRKYYDTEEKITCIIRSDLLQTSLLKTSDLQVKDLLQSLVDYVMHENIYFSVVLQRSVQTCARVCGFFRSIFQNLQLAQAKLAFCVRLIEELCKWIEHGEEIDVEELKCKMKNKLMHINYAYSLRLVAGPRGQAWYEIQGPGKLESMLGIDFPCVATTCLNMMEKFDFNRELHVIGGYQH